MDRNLLTEVVNLKEKRRVLMAECGRCINENTFSKEELKEIKKHRNDPEACKELDFVNALIAEDEELLKKTL